MTKKNELTERVHELIAFVDKTHRYSMSVIYGLWNEVFGKAETPQSCASCLMRKVDDLRRWLSEQDVLLQNEKQKRVRRKRASK